MTQVTPEEINQFRVQLANHPDAVAALDEIEDCEGDVEDAAIALAIKVGQQPDIANTEWLPSLAKKCRVALCQSELRNDWENGNFGIIFEYLQDKKICPRLLITPVLIYVFKQNINKFCEPLEQAVNSKQ